jgi:hypothetical protein
MIVRRGVITIMSDICLLLPHSSMHPPRELERGEMGEGDTGIQKQ